MRTVFYNNDKVFKIAIGISIFLHTFIFVLFASNILKTSKKPKSTTYYVDLMNYSGGGGGGEIKTRTTGSKTDKSSSKAIKKSSMKDLTKEKETIHREKPELTYPDEKKKAKKSTKQQEKTEKKIVKKDELQQAYDNYTINKEQTGEESSSGIGFGVGKGDQGSGGSLIGSFPYAYYIDIIKNRVSSRWITGTLEYNLKKEYSVIVSFQILRTGIIRNINIEKSSGIDSLDTSAIRAVKNSRFPPLPQGYEDNYLSVLVQFVLENKKN